MRPLYVRMSDYRCLLSSTGPLFACIFPWTLVLIGQLAALCNIIVPEYSTFYLIVIGNIFSILFLAFSVQTFFPQQLSKNQSTIEDVPISGRFKRIIYGLIGFYLLFQLFQIAVFKGFPFIWLLMRSSKHYFDYGIHSLNGLLNAVYLLSTTAFFLIYLKEKSRKKLCLLLLLLSVPILLVSRQLLMSVFIQIACCALLYNPKKLKSFLKFALLLFVVFVYVGNLRTGMGPLIEILGPKEFIPKMLYPLLWIYAYVVTPFNNVNANIDAVTPIGSPAFELNQLIPSVFRGMLGLETSDTGYSLVHQNMTVSTFYLEPLLDFGQLYAFFFMAVFQLFFILAYRRAVRTKSPIHIVEYSVFYMIAILSIFSNLLLYLPVVAQLGIINLAKLKLFRKAGHLVFAAGPDV